MKNSGTLKSIVIIVLAVFVITGLVRHFHIKHFRVVEPGVFYISGQPRGMDYTRLLYKYHIGTFINVRSSAEHREQLWYNHEVTWMRQNGAKYIELPVPKAGPNANFPDENTRRQFISVIRDPANRPVLLHCSNGTSRAPLFAAIYFVQIKGLTIEQTLTNVEKLKDEALSAGEIEFIRTLLQR